jgi:uncharacterized low-complexity protein
MSEKTMLIKPVAAALGIAFVSSLTITATAAASDNPFVAADLQHGYLLAGDTDANADANADDEEGKCGEGKCGEGRGEDGKCGEGKCGEDKEGMGEREDGKCGEGKCGEDKAEGEGETPAGAQA